MTRRLPTRPHLLKESLNSTKARTKPLKHGPLGGHLSKPKQSLSGRPLVEPVLHMERLTQDVKCFPTSYGVHRAGWFILQAFTDFIDRMTLAHWNRTS
jgi:hypothetical protein